jgi:hypothetical protein
MLLMKSAGVIDLIVVFRYRARGVDCYQSARYSAPRSMLFTSGYAEQVSLRSTFLLKTLA